MRPPSWLASCSLAILGYQRRLLCCLVWLMQAASHCLASAACATPTIHPSPPSHRQSIQNPLPNAYTLAIAGRKPFIVLHTALLDLLTPEEVQVGGGGGGWRRRRVGQQANTTGLQVAGGGLAALPECAHATKSAGGVLQQWAGNGCAVLPCRIACWAGKLAQGSAAVLTPAAPWALTSCAAKTRTSFPYRRCWHTSWAT